MAKAEKLFIIIPGLIVICCITLGIIDYIQTNNACEELGYEKHSSKCGFTFCVDDEGNYHYVEIIYKKFIFDIDVKEISVGDVRVKKND